MSEVAYIGRMVKIDGKMYLEVGLGERRKRSAKRVPASMAQSASRIQHEMGKEAQRHLRRKRHSTDIGHKG